MKQIVSMFGSVVGWAGVILCLLAGIVKLGGAYYLLGYEVMAIFTVGIGMIATGCLAKLESKG